MNSLWLPYELPIEPYERLIELYGFPSEAYKLLIALYMNSLLPVELYELPMEPH